MSLSNPTSIRLGMVGSLLGKRYRIAGRVVMGMTEEGQTYYWNEFNLVGVEGGSATLVFEDTDQGGQWRLFTAFEPENPMSPEDAASKQVGNLLNLEGTDVRITLISESRVCQVEGVPANDEQVGETDHYFNAQGGNTMIVVSWSGDKVEFFQGKNISYGTVKAAFNPADEMPGGFGALLGSPTTGSSAGNWFKVVGPILVLVLFGVVYWFSGLIPRPKAVISYTASPAPLKVGSTGLLDGKTCRLSAHEVVESAHVGFRYERHEYQLTDSDGNQALLVYGWKPGSKDWLLFSHLQPLAPLTPEDAAARRMGDVVDVGGYTVPVSGLFRETIRLTENAESTSPSTRTVHYGFSGQTGPTVILVRWREDDIAFYAGTALPSKAVEAAFGLNH
jgi:hypothetical protein